MELRNRATGAVITDAQLRAELPNTSLPKVLTPSILSDLGYDPVLEGPQPVLVPPYQTSARNGIYESGGQWFTKYIAIEPDEDGKAAMDAAQAERIRTDRNQRLAASDWTQVPDAVNAGISIDAWASYRQQLRDVTAQPGFPWDVTWPEPPEPVAGVICDYKAFYDALLISPAYATIRGKAVESSSVLTACVEFIAAIGDAKSGRPNVAAIQACVDLLCAAAQFTAEELQALATVMEVGKLDQVYTLPEA
jgi:hypothetical protein